MSRPGDSYTLPSMPDFSTSAPNMATAGNLKQQLQNLLESKERQLEQAGTLGQKLLAQRLELEARVQQIHEQDADKSDSDDLDDESMERYQDLADTIRTWDRENAALSGTFSAKSSVNGNHFAPPLPLSELPREELDRKSNMGASTAAQSRRAKNAAHRADDVEFAFEIGSGLLTEVRRLQSLLAERDKAMQDLKEEKDDSEKNVENMRSTLRQQEQSADKYREENWNLEVALQELRTQMAESQATSSRLTAESNKLNKALASSLTTAETHKNEVERLQTAYDELKVRHDTDTAQNRKNAAGLQREKGDLQQALDRAKQEVVRAGRKLPRGFGSPLTPGGGLKHSHLTPAAAKDDDDDVFSNLGAQSTNRHRRHDTGEVYGIVDDRDSSPEGSPTTAPQEIPPSSDVEVLQQRLAHAQRQINTLKSTLQREKETRMEYRRKLEASTGFVPAAEDIGEIEGDDQIEAADSSKRRVTPYKNTTRGYGRGIRGKGGRISALTQKLGLAAAESDSGDDYSEEMTAQMIPTVPVIPSAFATSLGDELREHDEALEQDLDISQRTSIASVDGMDPAFANILRKPAENPLRQGVMSRSMRGGMRRSRGGAAQNESRPTSFVGQPEPLAAELGLGSGSLMAFDEQTQQPIPVETLEVACQTEVEAISGSVESPTMVDSSVQVNSEPVIVPPPTITPPVVQTSSIATQTDVESAPIQSEVAVQSEEISVPPARQFNDIATSPVLQASSASLPLPSNSLEALSSSTQMTKLPSAMSIDTAKTSTDNTITHNRSRAFLAGRPDADERTEAELETESETDTDHYTDAPQSARGGNFTDMQESREDFHSLLDRSDNNFSASDEDADSIKASRLAYRRSGRVTSPAVKLADSPKVELKEMSVQTDEWRPTPAPPQVVPPSPGFSMIRPGSMIQQQFQFISPPVSGALSPDVFPPESTVQLNLRDSTLGSVRARTFSADRRQSLMSANADASKPRLMSTQVDKTKPPVMTVPPPPRQPPPVNSMPPPSFIPDRTGRDLAPNRPSSPPPADLIQRATTPLGSRVRGGSDLRQAGSSMPPLTSMRQPASNGSFRSATNMAATYMSVSPVATNNRSKTSVVYERSPRSSISSEQGGPFASKQDSSTVGIAPRIPARYDMADTTVQGPAVGSTDPNIIHAITQTMIGEFLYKYTRKTIGKGHGDKRHKRFFWVHPYTKTLYWSSADPGSSNVSESLAKSAYIDGVRSVLDPNPMPPGLYQYSVVVSTPQREMKFTAPTKERHDIWLSALKYLLARPNAGPITSPGNDAIIPTSPISMNAVYQNDENRPPHTPSPQRSPRAEGWSTTPRVQRSRSLLSQGSIGKRSGTPAVEYMKRWNGPESPYSPSRSFEHVEAQDDDDDDNLDFELHESGDGGFEGLENVRACCNGKHVVGGHHQHHHHYHGQNLSEPNQDPNRPASPAWSFRSRTSSIDKDTGKFSWGRGEDGKLRFGSRRSTKTSSKSNVA